MATGTSPIATRAAEHREHDVFDQQQPKDSTTTGTEGEAKSDFSAPRNAAREHEGRDVGADDQQQQRAHRAQHHGCRQHVGLRTER